jgi:hypothetical protein
MRILSCDFPDFGFLAQKLSNSGPKSSASKAAELSTFSQASVSVVPHLTDLAMEAVYQFGCLRHNGRARPGCPAVCE